MKKKILSLFLLFLIVINLFRGPEGFLGRLYLSGPTKCFSCERELLRLFGSKYTYMGKPSKCFDCEKQIHRSNPGYEVLSQPTKCFSCEKQYLVP